MLNHIFANQLSIQQNLAQVYSLVSANTASLKVTEAAVLDTSELREAAVVSLHFTCIRCYSHFVILFKF